MAVRDHYRQNKITDLGTEEETLEVFDRIIAVISISKGRLFAVSRREKAQVLSTIAELHYRRLIHDVPLADVPAQLRTKYYLYHADLGLVLDARRELINEVEHVDEILRPIAADEISLFVILIA